MKAAVLRGAHQPLSIEDIQISNPRSHEVLIRTSGVGVCHSDLHYMEGFYAAPMPSVLGHESAGVVEKVGPEVRYVKPGDHRGAGVFEKSSENQRSGAMLTRTWPLTPSRPPRSSR